MLSEEAITTARKRVRLALAQAGIALTRSEIGRIEVADFGLSHLEIEGLQIVTYINTDRVCAKELVMFPRQTCPEHRHPPVAGDPGKEETFRCRQGTVYVYTPGEPSATTAAPPPPESAGFYTVFHRTRLHPGEQVTIPPDTLHWFQAGDDGAVVSEFSTRSRDEADIFTDPRIVRATDVAGVSGAL